MRSGTYSQEDIDKQIEDTYKKYPHDENVQLEMGNLDFRKEELDKAKDMAKKILEKNAYNLRAVNLLSRISMKEGNFEEANKLLQKANSVSPKNADRLLLLGDTCFGLGNLDEAIEFYQEAADANPEKAGEAEAAMGKVMISKGDLESALGLLQKSASEEEAAGFFNNAAVFSVKEGNFKKAIDLYEMAIKTLKTDKLKYKIYYNMALAYKRDGDAGQAVKMLKRSLKYEPSYEKASKQLDEINSSATKRAS